MSGTSLYSEQCISTSLKPSIFGPVYMFKSQNTAQAAHISERVQKRDVLFNITLHAAVSISYVVPSKPQYITYDTFMTPWCNRHIYKKAWGWKLGKDKFLSNKHKSLHYSIWANLCYHALYRSSACIIRPIQSALLISCYLCY